MTFAVTVAFTVRPEHLPDFRTAMAAQARNSLRLEPGCLRFDVCHDAARPDQVFLYELYTDAAAFDTHLASEHFKSFKATVDPWLVRWTIDTWTDGAVDTGLGPGDGALQTRSGPRMDAVKRIGLVAHDALKPAMVAWVTRQRSRLAPHDLVATGTTGTAIVEATGLGVERLRSGPLGGDAQLGARIVEGRLDVLVFFTDPLTAMPHDVDVKALVRLAVLHDVALACNEASADFLLSSPLIGDPYQRRPLNDPD